MDTQIMDETVKDETVNGSKTVKAPKVKKPRAPRKPRAGKAPKAPKADKVETAPKGGGMMEIPKDATLIPAIYGKDPVRIWLAEHSETACKPALYTGNEAFNPIPGLRGRAVDLASGIFRTMRGTYRRVRPVSADQWYAAEQIHGYPLKPFKALIGALTGDEIRWPDGWKTREAPVVLVTMDGENRRMAALVPTVVAEAILAAIAWKVGEPLTGRGYLPPMSRPDLVGEWAARVSRIGPVKPDADDIHVKVAGLVDTLRTGAGQAVKLSSADVRAAVDAAGAYCRLAGTGAGLEAIGARPVQIPSETEEADNEEAAPETVAA